jgi:hypothetical protein
VKQISTDQLVQRKVLLVLKTVDPELVSEAWAVRDQRALTPDHCAPSVCCISPARGGEHAALCTHDSCLIHDPSSSLATWLAARGLLQGVWGGFFGVIAVLRVNFARAITLGAAIADTANSAAETTVGAPPPPHPIYICHLTMIAHPTLPATLSAHRQPVSNRLGERRRDMHTRSDCQCGGWAPAPAHLMACTSQSLLVTELAPVCVAQVKPVLVEACPPEYRKWVGPCLNYVIKVPLVPTPRSAHPTHPPPGRSNTLTDRCSGSIVFWIHRVLDPSCSGSIVFWIHRVLDPSCSGSIAASASQLVLASQENTSRCRELPAYTAAVHRCIGRVVHPARDLLRPHVHPRGRDAAQGLASVHGEAGHRRPNISGPGQFHVPGGLLGGGGSGCPVADLQRCALLLRLLLLLPVRPLV